jgi:hypothetical protein
MGLKMMMGEYSRDPLIVIRKAFPRKFRSHVIFLKVDLDRCLRFDEPEQQYTCHPDGVKSDGFH